MYIEIENICYSYGKNRILKNISFSVPKGRFLSLIGPNGSGKSTLIKVISGINKPECGNVEISNKDIESISFKERAKIIATIYQRNTNEFPISCIELILMGLHPHRNRFEQITEEEYKKLEEIMKLTDTYELSNKLITEVSGGELQRVNIARAIMQKPKILLMDESMADMDIHAKIKMNGILKKLVKEEGLTVIAINHDLNMAYKFSDLIVALDDGKVDSVGKPDEVMNVDFFERVFHVRAEIFKGKGFFIHENI